MDDLYDDELDFGYIADEPDRYGRYREEKKQEVLDKGEN